MLAPITGEILTDLTLFRPLALLGISTSTATAKMEISSRFLSTDACQKLLNDHILAWTLAQNRSEVFPL